MEQIPHLTDVGLLYFSKNNNFHVNSIMNRLKAYIFDSTTMTKLPMVSVLQHIDDHNLIYCLCLIK